jgi:ubiquitin carboxyl-terminal hydrolase 36/42
VAVLSPSVKKTRTKGVAGSTDQKSLYTGPIDTTWPPKSRVGRGFNNTGNTCFLNSALQCLLHTAPLVRILSDHRKETCASVFGFTLSSTQVSTPLGRVKNSFCMICALRQTMVDSQTKFTSTPPYLIITKLQRAWGSLAFLDAD